MQRFLQLTPDDQKLTIEQTAARIGWAASSVEKDFWVCWTLQQLFAMPELAPHLTFKGGTSLSKAWGLIDRFSEDIDLTINREALGFGGEDSPGQAPSKKQTGKRLKELKAACKEFVHAVVLPNLSATMQTVLGKQHWKLQPDQNDPDSQTVLFEYPTYFQVQPDRYVSSVVKIEFGARSDPWPAHAVQIIPIMAKEFPQAFAAPECTVLALAPERTFWEKAMLLHEETYRPADKKRGARMARHYYDLYRLIEQGVGANAAADLSLFEKVAEHRKIFFPQTWVDYATIRAGTLRLSPLPEQEAGWRQDYADMQGEMFSNLPPAFDTLLFAIHIFELTFNQRIPR
ncbi:MAG: nucleotidyl transferase AbiEii/AbiGii toxin family protein [Pseudomonadota bacterium]